MDNVVQNISIEDIIPSKFQPSSEEQRKIEELAQLIKSFGLIDPILVRPKNDKYEIVLGMDKYQAALIAKQNKIPAIIKEIDDETFSKYSNIDTKQQASINSLTTEKRLSQKNNSNSDIINLAELSKIKIEYERDDLKMNNGQLNNNMMNNNFEQTGMNQANPAPTFGGRFFPSLEDEPTNMNMMGGINSGTIPPEVPNLGNQPVPNNNLIDLTDLSIDKEPAPAPSTDFGAPTINTSPIEPMSTINSPSISPSNFGISTPESPSMPTATDTIINLDNLQNNNPAVQPISEPVSMETLNADFGAPTPMPTQFELPQNNAPQIPSTSEFNQPVGIRTPDFGVNQTPTGPAEPSMMKMPMSPEFNVNPAPAANSDFEVPAPIAAPASAPAAAPLKNITPVTSTIRNLVSSLETFGYKINITEEDLPTSAKLTIEVEK